MLNSLNTKNTLTVGQQQYTYFDVKKLKNQELVKKLPITLTILLENLLRFEDGQVVKSQDIDSLLQQVSSKRLQKEIAFVPARVLLQDFTGVPAIVDLAVMRDALAALGKDPNKINPLQPAELVIDHSIQVDKFGTNDALDANAVIEFKRNKERYGFLRWGQTAFDNFKVVPPETGIVHQVNLEYLARVIFEKQEEGQTLAYPDTVVGTDSHTTMINGLGVLGWGVGGIEAEAALLGQPISMLIPEVVGFKISGKLPEGATATDLVLTIVEILREKGVVGKFVEFFGDGLTSLPLADRATIANMAPEYGATCGFFPIDNETLRYLKLSGRPDSQIARVKAYAQAQGIFRHDGDAERTYSDVLSLDLSHVEPSIAGPKRPQDRIPLKVSQDTFKECLQEDMQYTGGDVNAKTAELKQGDVVIAAITSCTNTSNPAVMLGAGLVAKKALDKGLRVPAWVKTSLAPGSRVVTEYLKKSGLLQPLEALGFNLVGYGCTTCIGNSGPLPENISQAIHDKHLSVCSVLSGNRNFEGRIHPEVRLNYLASPPLVVIYALAGTMDIDLYYQPLGTDKNNQPVYMKDIWPTQQEVQEAIEQSVDANMFTASYADVFAGDERWRNLDVPTGERFAWDEHSTYVKKPPYFDGITQEVPTISDIKAARVLVYLGDSVTTDHISPAGAIKIDSPAGKYLTSLGVKRGDFNSYGSRRGNHEVMMRGTFANVRLRNLLAPGTEGSVTRLQPDNQEMSIYDAAMAYNAKGVAQIVLAGKEYGSGSSRDWAAKGPRLLGVKAVIAESYERIHRSNLVGMGVLPLEFTPGHNAKHLGLSGKESFDIIGLDNAKAKTVNVIATPADGSEPIRFKARVRLDTPKEQDYYRHGGILHYVLRQLAADED